MMQTPTPIVHMPCMPVYRCTNLLSPRGISCMCTLQNICSLKRILSRWQARLRLAAVCTRSKMWVPLARIQQLEAARVTQLQAAVFELPAMPHGRSYNASQPRHCKENNRASYSNIWQLQCTCVTITTMTLSAFRLHPCETQD